MKMKLHLLFFSPFPFTQLSQILEVGQNIDRVICQTVCSLDTITNTLELKKKKSGFLLKHSAALGKFHHQIHFKSLLYDSLR